MRVAFPVPIASADSSPDFTARAVTHCQYSPLLSFSKLFVILVGLLPGAAPETTSRVFNRSVENLVEIPFFGLLKPRE
jgi:hypothetical protein